MQKNSRIFIFVRRVLLFRTRIYRHQLSALNLPPVYSMQKAKKGTANN